MSENVTLTIDGREVTVPKGTLVIRAAEQLGIFIPRFCDHPLLDPLGACRQCIVEVEGQRKPMTSCTTVVSDGMVVRTQMSSEMAKDAQEGVLELLLINHPLDCPMCDKGGECPLQDQALEYGPSGSRFVEQKRRFTKPVSISPLVKLDRERCVLCARCTRFSEQIAGDPFIELLERGALEQVAIYEDEPFQSEFSGNVVQICPVGALTATPYRFQARPFETTTTISTCNRCASGCKTLVQERRGQLVRVLSGSNYETQDEWICDKGRFGYAYAQTPERITEPLMRKGDSFVPVSWAEAIDAIGGAVRSARDAREPMAAIGGAQLVDEDAYALARFARVVLGTNDVDARFGGTTGADDQVLSQIAAGAPTAGFADIDSAATVISIGLDLREVSPIVFLRVRKNARRGLQVIDVGARRSRLGEAGASWVEALPGQEVEALKGLDVAGPVVLLVGDQLIGDGSFAAAWNLALDRGWNFGWVPRKANARGSLESGCAPHLLPGGRQVLDDAHRAEVQKVWNAAPSPRPGRDGATILREAADLGVLLIAGADPVADAPGALKAGTSVEAAGFVIVIDLFLTDTARAADVILPATSVYERTGTLTSWEGRKQPVRGAVEQPGLAQDDRAILSQIAAELGHTGFPLTAEELKREMRQLATSETPERSTVEVESTPDSPARGSVLIAGTVLIDSGSMMHGANELNRTAHDPRIELNPEDAADAGIAEGSLVRIETAHGRASGTAKLTQRVARGAVWVPAQLGVLHGIDLVSAGGYTSVKVSRGDA